MLYHKNTGMPEVKISQTKIKPRYSIHAQDEAVKDIYNIIELPYEINLADADIFEVETNGKKIVKIAFRVEYDEIFDLCFAMLIPSNRVKTVWLNEKIDNHDTLDKTKYD